MVIQTLKGFVETMKAKIKTKTKKIKGPSIAERNALFERLTPEERRIEIAKDVLMHLEKGKYEARCGNYVNIPQYFNTYDHDFDSDMCTLVESVKETCQVCARGAFFLSSVLKFDRCKISGFVSDHLSGSYTIDVANENISNFVQHETTYFTEIQLGLIEQTFECYSGCDSGQMSQLRHTDRLAAKRYGRAYYDPTARLIAICNNIIDNKGEFVIPEKYYEAV